MRPPLPNGTVLQNRYRLLSILGQGGFGRTYLAEDQGRFNELCAIKELIPSQGDAYTLSKSQELFQREAQILYQIQHPQIPQFRANFGQDQRFFLVQDYVEGQTYRTLLDQHKARGFAFSEPEVLQLLQQLLPVLAHIHAKGIIHRDISPDNIILREKDHLPVLIDFGVVKELATQFQSSLQSAGTAVQGATQPQNTTVGKLGYAPSEQMQTGRAYPCSDLYSLAVSAVVLLTGHEPQDLFDDATLTWYWQRWVSVSPGLAMVLNRMLSYRPGDRFQSVAEVAQALQAPYVSQPPTYPLVQPSYPAQPSYPVAPVVPSQPTNPPAPDLSHMRTMAVGRQPDAIEAPNRSNQSGSPNISPRSSMWDDPGAVILLGVGLVLLTGVGSWAIVRAVLTNQPTPTPSETVAISPSPTVSISASPKPTPTPTPDLQPFTKRLSLTPGEKITEIGKVGANQVATYIISAEQGQELTTAVTTEGVLMTVKGPNDQSLAKRVQSWQETLPYTGEYRIELSPVKGLQQSRYQLDLNLKNPPKPSPSPSPSVSPSPVIDPVRVSFPQGEMQTQISDKATPQVIKRYLVSVEAGQTLLVKIAGAKVAMDIRTPDGQVIGDGSQVLQWNNKVSASGDYQIDVVASQNTGFDLVIGINK